MPEMTASEILATGIFLIMVLPAILIVLARWQEKLLGGYQIPSDQIEDERLFSRSSAPYDWMNDPDFADIDLEDDPEWS